MNWLIPAVFALGIVPTETIGQALEVVEGKTVVSSQDGGRTISVRLQGENGIKIEFVWIEAGTFLMGTPADEPGFFSEEGPQRPVTISQGFYLGKHEITQAQWEAVMGEKTRRSDDASSLPVDFVPWGDVQVFTQNLNSSAGTGLYRLPTEAEWEYAARAGSTTKWFFGDDASLLSDYAWYDTRGTRDSSGEKREPVGTKLPNPWGLYDMYGNVGEWVADWFADDYYAAAPQVDPQGPEDGSFRVIRGGGFFVDTVNWIKSASRGFSFPDAYYDYVGARLARSGPRLSAGETAVTRSTWGQVKQ